MSDNGLTLEQLLAMYKRFETERNKRPGPRLSQSEFVQQVRRIEAEIAKEMPSAAWYNRYLETQLRIRAMRKNPLRPEGNSQTNVTDSDT